MRKFLFFIFLIFIFSSCANDTSEKLLDKCNDIKCSNHGICAIDINNNTVCICNEGFHSDKLECIANEIIENPCKDIKSCDDNGKCAVDLTNKPVCVCNGGFHADNVNLKCVANDIIINPCENVISCNDHGVCAVDNDNKAVCACDTGYHANNTNLTCVRNSTDLCEGIDCGSNSTCKQGICECNSGYHDDTNTCVANTCGTDNHEIEKIEGNFYDFVKNYDYLPALDDNGNPVNPDEEYIKPSEAYITSFKAAIKALIKGDICTAEEKANEADMKIIKYIDTRDGLTINKDIFTNEYICIMGKDESNDVNHDPSYFRGLYCMRNYIETNTYTRNIHIAIPHPLHDVHTNIEGAEVFENTGARYFSLSTTNRCADPIDTPCTTALGTHICNGTSYKISDMAHNTTSLFYQFSKQIQDLDTSYHFQIHGFGEDSFPERVAVTTIGSKDVKVNSNRLVRRFTNKLNTLINQEDSSKKVISCNDPNITQETLGDDNLIKLCATTNTIGRYINGAINNSCQNDGLSFAHSRFLHLEQTRWLRGNSTYTPKYYLITNTVNSIFPAVKVLESQE